MKPETPHIIPVDEARLTDFVVENGKLRKLVRDMFDWYIKSECSNCEYKPDCHKFDKACDYMRKFIPNMIELGIEVDE